MMNENMVVSMIVMKRVVHLGPSESKGGMATVMENMVENVPEGWFAESLKTHSENILQSLICWKNASRTFTDSLKNGEYDVAHIHVTHGFSWWRKLSFMKKCEQFGIPAIIHIHSGKFHSFCSGLSGNNVKKELSRKNRVTIILEDRWRDMLRDWIPEDSEVVRNFSNPVKRDRKRTPSDKLRLLVLSRNSPVKGHDFAIEVAKCISQMGKNVELLITGGSEIGKYSNGRLEINNRGWVSREEKDVLLSESDFLLSPSEYEGSSMSVIESMVSGLPCIVSGTSEETVGLEDLIVRENNSEKWANRILTLSDSTRYLQVVDSMLEESQKYRPETNRTKIEKIYNNLCSKQP